MSIQDKAATAGEQIKGQAKEAAGRASNDPNLEAEGRQDQVSAKVKKVGEAVKDLFR